MPRGFKGFWAAIIWARMGVGSGLLGNGIKEATNGIDMEMKERIIGRIWCRIKGVWEIWAIV